MLILKNLSGSGDLIAECLRKGGVICFPTETVYALACDATLPNAIARIQKIKNRDANKPLSLLAYDIKTAKRYVFIDDKAISVMKKFSPGPITYILPNKALNNWPDFLGIRIPKHPTAQAILKNYSHLLVGTSVNISGKASARTSEEIPEKIRDCVDIIVNDTPKMPASGLPSTVVDMSMPGRYKILREGPVNKAEIDEIADQK